MGLERVRVTFEQGLGTGAAVAQSAGRGPAGVRGGTPLSELINGLILRLKSTVLQLKNSDAVERGVAVSVGAPEPGGSDGASRL